MQMISGGQCSCLPELFSQRVNSAAYWNLEGTAEAVNGMPRASRNGPLLPILLDVGHYC